MQQGGPPHGNQGMPGGYMPPNQQQQQQAQQQAQQGMGQPMGYYQQQAAGQYNQMGMQMGYQGPPSGPPGAGGLGQPSAHTVGSSLRAGQPHQGMVPPQASAQSQQTSQQPSQQAQSHSAMMSQQAMYGQQGQMGDFGRPQYMSQGYGNAQAGPQVSIAQHQGLSQQAPTQNSQSSLSQPVHQQTIHASHHTSLQPPIHTITQPIPLPNPNAIPNPSIMPPSQPPPPHPAYLAGLGQSASHSAAPAAPVPVPVPVPAPVQPNVVRVVQQDNTAARNAKKQLQIMSYSTDILDNLDRYSVGGLCNIAKELIHELNQRTVTMCTMLKQADRKNPSPAQDIDVIVDYCLMLFDKLAEIRVRIDKRMGSKALKTDEFLKMFEDPTDPPDIRPEELKRKMELFKANGERLTALSHDLKLLDWMATVSDPSLLKKVDKMSCFSQNQQSG